MQILQTKSFSQIAKKLHGNTKKELDSAVRSVMSNPLIGQQKAGDLVGVYVYKLA